ncbi:MAG: hypothetical protein WBD81_10360 [Collimonas pratensis]|uniref:hypothetical protein n=1 Tax=Collimonas pratensis TaxID=279113 RepID=UPI003C759BD7
MALTGGNLVVGNVAAGLGMERGADSVLANTQHPTLRTCHAAHIFWYDRKHPVAVAIVAISDGRQQRIHHL